MTGRSAERRELARAPGQDAVEHIDRCAGRERDGRLPLRLRGDEEAPAAGFVESGNDARMRPAHRRRP